MISDHFWKILLLLIVLGGSFFWYQDYAEKQKMSSMAGGLAELIVFSPETLPKDDEEAHQRFLKAIAVVHNARNDGTDVGDLVDAALTDNELSLSGTRASMIRKAIFDAENQGKKLGIFTEDTIWDLLDGQKVKITEGAHSGEQIAITRRVPTSIAKGAEFFPGNFALVPESIANVTQDLVLTEHILTTSGDLAAADVISASDANIIKKQFYKHRKK